jgi:hypothetical protein
MSTHTDLSSIHPPQAIVPVRPATAAATAAGTTPAPAAGIQASLLRRTLGGKFPSRRTLGNKIPSRRTLGGKVPSRRTLGGKIPSRRTLGGKLP